MRWINFPRPEFVFSPVTFIKAIFNPASRKMAGASPSGQSKMGEAACVEIEALLCSLNTAREGLSEAEAEARLEKYGYNEVEHEKPPRWYAQVFGAFQNPLILLLIGLAVLSYLTDDATGSGVIAAMVLLSGLLRFIQEFRSNRAAEQLKAMVRTTATVVRQEAAPSISRREFGREVPLKLLVPGDLVRLAAGDMVPADVRLIAAKDLFVSQAALTGEALPVEKFELAEPDCGDRSAQPPTESMPLFDAPHLCFMGTNVISGTASAVVVATGKRTSFGALARTAAGRRAMTSFDKGVNSVSWLLIKFMLVMAPLVFLINGLTKGNWIEAFFFALAVAVGLTPEMLPMIVTANLARGAVSLSRQRVIVKNLNAIQNLGAMDVLCTDKTGTLTRDQIVLERHLDVFGATKEEVLHYAYLNSAYQTGLKNLLDLAVLSHGELNHALRLEEDYRKVDEIPFDFVRRRMSVVVETGGRHLLICKGAVEEMLSICSRAELGGRREPLTDALRQRAKGTRQELNEAGMRVIAVAYNDAPARRAPYSVKDEADLVLAGFLAFLDPPKESASEAIAALAQHGVQVKVLTGDNEVVTRRICRDVGVDAEHCLLGIDIEGMSEAELEARVERTTIFAKLYPTQKSRVIRALQRQGHTVGFLGDGINDAPALRVADVGISVDTAVDIAKESADMILLEKSLLVLESGVLEGRRTFGNIVKYIKMGISSNFGNMFSVLGASALLPFLPMLPLQLLANNLLYDLSQTGIPFDNVDPEYLAKPRRWMVNDIGRFMLFIGPISSIFDYTTYALMWYVFQANTEARQSMFQSGWFIESLFSQTLIVHMIRTGKVPFLQSRASMPLLLLTTAIIACGIYLPFSPLAPHLGLTALPRRYFLWLSATLLGYCLLTQYVKRWYLKRFQMWL